MPETQPETKPETPPNFWGYMPEEEYYTSEGVRNSKEYFETPNGKLFTQSFLPLDQKVKATVYMSHGYGSDTGWMFQKICINFATWGYAVFAADLLGHGRSDGIRCYLGEMEKVAASSLSFFKHVRYSEPYKDLPAFLFENMKPSKVHLFMYGLLFGLADTWAAMPDNKMVGKAIKDPEKLKIHSIKSTEVHGKAEVHGTADGVTCPTSSQLLYEKASSADKSIKIYDGMYHSLIQGEPDENAELVLKDMREWIDERVKRYGPKNG
ncbi:hypothetical protein Patl1_34338 [Pistacia atlantica]|uniref:Uncharacterized protein n=1 Tax=Pistacia atlantica TaxID=434234 RepID=A0ACC0ZTN0_9ROSI|nr:hypothetical protein Patl1_34338 [Pistacia atlantica]